MRPSWKLYALECLYLLICNIAVCVAAMVQCIGKSYQGEHSSFIFSGSSYSYNPFAYILGLVLFIGALYAGYRLILRRTMDELGRAGALYVVVWLVIAAVFAVVTVVAVSAGLFLNIGMSGNMRPEDFLKLTAFGWPVILFIAMLIMAIYAKTKED
ncbi:MAG: hypothetical protein IKZ69_00725 [Lachnospiraceae bacterium]|nr:hypothetical protein [Lachnospiraceae bacterium]